MQDELRCRRTTRIWTAAARQRFVAVANASIRRTHEADVVAHRSRIARRHGKSHGELDVNNDETVAEPGGDPEVSILGI